MSAVWSRPELCDALARNFKQLASGSLVFFIFALEAAAFAYAAAERAIDKEFQSGNPALIFSLAGSALSRRLFNADYVFEF